METKELILTLLDTYVNEAESSFHWDKEWDIKVGRAADTVILEVLSEEVQNKRHPMRQACLLDIIRSGTACVDHLLFCDITFEMIRQEISNISHESKLLTQRDEDGMYLINEIMQILYWECHLPYDIEKYRNEFIEIAFLVGKFEYQENSETNDFSFYFLDCAIEKITKTLGNIARIYTSEPALTCLQEISQCYKSSFFANKAFERYVESWRYLNITYEIHYQDKVIERAKMYTSEMHTFTELIAKEKNIDFTLYSSDNQWLRLLKNEESVILFYQDKEGIVWHSVNIDMPHDETPISFILRDGCIKYLPCRLKIYYRDIDVVDRPFIDLIRLGKVIAYKKRKESVGNFMYFGLEKCDMDYLS